MKESDKNFIEQKSSLIKSLEDIADYLGDEDAKKVSLSNNSSGLTLDTHSANSTEHQNELAESN